MRVVRRHIEVVPQERGAVLFDKGRGIYFQVNDLGLVVVEGLASGKDREEMTRTIAEEFGISEEKARSDFDTFVKDLQDMGLA